MIAQWKSKISRFETAAVGVVMGVSLGLILFSLDRKHDYAAYEELSHTLQAAHQEPSGGGGEIEVGDQWFETSPPPAKPEPPPAPAPKPVVAEPTTAMARWLDETHALSRVADGPAIDQMTRWWNERGLK